MKKVVAAAAMLMLALASNAFAERCTMVGSYTQGDRTTEFSWSVDVSERRGRGLSIHGKASDRYGMALIDGRCNGETEVCYFTKSYVSGRSNGSTFYYVGKAEGDDITGKWGFQKGSYNGGLFTAQVINCK